MPSVRHASSPEREVNHLSTTLRARRSPAHGAIVTATLPVVAIAGLSLGASQANAAPAPSKAPTHRPAPATVKAAVQVAAIKAPKTVTVKPGDSVWALANKHGVKVADVLRLNRLSPSALIRPGQTLVLRGEASTGAAKKPAAKPSGGAARPAASATVHTVKHGDTLSGIAHKYGVKVADLLKTNGIRNAALIHPGQRITIKGASKAPTSSSVATSGSSSPSTGSATQGKAARSYTIKAGDTLSVIAKRHGISLKELTAANRLSASSVIYPGKTLTLPGGSGGSTGTSSSGSSKGSSGSLVPTTFLHYTYSKDTNKAANANKAALNAASVPSRAQMRSIVAATAKRYGVNPSLAIGHAMVESGMDARAVSPANAVGVMQVMPGTGDWMSDVAGRKLNLLDPHDNVTAGVLYIRYLQRNAANLEQGIAGYYQGLGGVRKNGMKPDTKDYVAKVKAAMGR